ncbi:hypothetical protein SLS58_007183 [Diplodia intermedia]|uniref:Uncharacterized protein n=1 Tax=Diplodia intermedia TaxID=856260 RepID=A0ABR3TKZ1_9PEZI
MASPSPPPRTREPSMPSDPGVLAIHARYYHKHMLQPAVDKLNLLLVNPRPTRCFDPRTPTPSPMAPSVSRLTSAPPSRRPSPAAPRANNRANPVPMHRMITRLLRYSNSTRAAKQ